MKTRTEFEIRTEFAEWDGMRQCYVKKCHVGVHMWDGTGKMDMGCYVKTYNRGYTCGTVSARWEKMDTACGHTPGSGISKVGMFRLMWYQ